MFVGDIDFTNLVGSLHVTGRFSGTCTIGSGVHSFKLDRSVFEQSLNFSRVNTSAFGDLVAVRVHGPLSVEHCSFNSLDSERSRFDGPVSVSDSTFRSEANFRDVTFNNDARFADCVREWRSVFVRARFNGRADFTGSRAAATIKWRAATFASPPSGAEHMNLQSR